MKTGLVITLGVLTAACSSGPRSGPTGPSSTGGGPASPATWTLSGELRPTTGDGVGGSVSFAGQQAVSDSGGRFTVTHAQAVPQPLTVARHDWLERQVWLAGGQTRTDLVVQPIAMVHPFSLTFYRQMVRDALEAPAPLPLTRWVTPPAVTVVSQARDGSIVDAVTVAEVVNAIRAAVEAYTPFGSLDVQVATEAPPIATGRIVVRFYTDAPGTSCGSAVVGGDRVELRLDCRCSGDAGRVSPRIVYHEMGHALGFYHTERGHIMHGGGSVCQLPVAPTATERFHARLAYSRPNGNRDPDHDPPSHLAVLAPASSSRREVSCLAP